MAYYGIMLYKIESLHLSAYIDVDWGKCNNDRHNRREYCLCLGNSLIYWSSGKQHVVWRSLIGAEFKALAIVV